MIGSGPFLFVASEWKPGEKIVFVKNTKYKPRAEPPSGLAGCHIVNVDRVELIALPGLPTQTSAFQTCRLYIIS